MRNTSSSQFGSTRLRPPLVAGRRRLGITVVSGSLALALAATNAAEELGPAVAAPPPAVAEVSEERLRKAVEFLASPALEGRGPGTKGLDRAAEWVAASFAQIGLSPPAPADAGEVTDDAVAFQPFAMTLEARLGPEDRNRAELVGPPGPDGEARVIPLECGRDFTPLAAGGSGVFDLPLAFLGYGITAPKDGYDDYAGIDAAGDAVVLLRHEPQQDNPHSVFNGNQNSRHAALSRKIANASEHEVGGVIFINDSVGIRRRSESIDKRIEAAVEAIIERKARRDARQDASEEEPGQDAESRQDYLEAIAAEAAAITNAAAELQEDGDGLMEFTRAGDGRDGRGIPILHLRRSVVEPVIREAADADLAEIEREIDRGPESHSLELDGWRIRGETAVERVETTARNVLAVLPGAGPHAEEVVVLGAHYDHLGYGGPSSAAPGVKAVHHGADDNASGTAMLVEVARLLAAEGPLPRTVLFAAFAGEERGLLGSAHYTDNPAVPLERTVAMVNLDMVGRLDGEKLIVHGTGTGTGFEKLVDALAAAGGFELAKEPGGFGPSDHASFYGKKIPVLHLFTGSHEDYHRPTDTAEKINYEGMTRITRMVAGVVRALASAEEPPDYVEVASTRFAGGGGDRPYFGSIPDFGKPGGGYAISGVSKGSPADRGGLEGGDLIIRLGESAIANLEDFDNALRKHAAGEKVPVVVRRGGAEVALEVVLDPPR